jgi:hypothetical protein
MIGLHRADVCPVEYVKYPERNRKEAGSLSIDGLRCAHWHSQSLNIEEISQKSYQL